MNKVKGIIAKLFMNRFLWMGMGISILFLSFTSCSKEEIEAGEWDNWQSRNEAYFTSLADSLRVAPNQWKRIKCYSLNPETEGKADDYIYVKILEQGTENESPAFTDSVRVIYQGRLIPSASFAQGYVFDGTVDGTFSAATGSTAKMLVSNSVDGFCTALQYMHRGDYWRVFIPSALGYGNTVSSSGGIPAYSTLIFDLMLIDFSHAGEELRPWSSRFR